MTEFDNTQSDETVRLPMLAETLAVDLQRVAYDQQIATAHRFPRRISVAMSKFEQLVLYNEAAAENAIYIITRDKKPIPGPSIGFANALYMAWGNCRCTCRWIATDRKEKLVVAEGSFYDYETNAEVLLTEQRRIGYSKGGVFSDDMIITTSKAAQAIARRNAILAGIPQTLWFPVYERALYMVRGTEATLPEKRDNALKALMQFGVAAKDVFRFLDVPDISRVTVAHIPTMRAWYQTLRNGEATVAELFDPRQMATGVIDDVNPLADPQPTHDGLGVPLNLKSSSADPQPKREAPAAEPGRQPPSATTTPGNASDGRADAADDIPSVAKIPQEERKANWESADREKQAQSAPKPKGGAKKPPEDKNAPAPAASEPQAVQAQPAPPAQEAAAAPAAAATQAAPADDEGFGDPVRQGGKHYIGYLRKWTAAATSGPEIAGRYRSERDTIRNRLGTPLTPDEIDQAKAIVAEATAALKGAPA